MKISKFENNKTSHLNMYSRWKAYIVIIIVPILFVVVGNPCLSWAWNSRGLYNLKFPEQGQECNSTSDWNCLGTHEWIVHEAIEFLKDNGYIITGTWFDNDEFKALLQWGVGYADHTGRKISAGFVISKDWDIDGFRHFYHPASVWVRITADESDSGITGLAHVGDLTAPEYANLLYERAVEFWPNGTPPIDLSTLTNPWYLGYTDDNLDRTYYSGWGQGTDPRVIWEVPNKNAVFDIFNYESCAEVTRFYYDDDNMSYVPYTVEECVSANKPEWPPWVNNYSGINGTPEEDEQTAAVFLGWALHMIQDMAVYHHTKNLHGIPHQDYEAETEGMVRANQSDFSNQLPILSGNQGNQTYTGKPFCTEYILCYADTMECSEEFEHCYDVFPNLPAYNLNLFDAKKLANSVAYYVFDQKRKEIDSHFEPPFVPYFNFNNEAYVKHCLDAAIKASAALIYKFIVDVSQEELPEDRFEPNDSYNMPWRLNPGSYNDLTIDNKEDNDYYLIEMPYRGDLEIRIDYDDKLSGIGAKLERIEMEWANQPYYPTQSSAGKIFKLKGIQKGKYMLHLQSGFIWGAPPNGADLTTTYYDLHITIGGKRLVADWYEDNDSPQTADESLLKYSGNTPGLTIDVEGDDDYYVVRAPVGYRIDIGITFNPSEGNLQLYFNGEKVVPKPLELSKNYSLDPNFMSEKILTIDERVLNELKNTPSLSPCPSFSDLFKSSISISRCSSGRDIIRVSGQPNNYEISLDKEIKLDACGIKLKTKIDDLSFKIWSAY